MTTEGSDDKSGSPSDDGQSKDWKEAFITDPDLKAHPAIQEFKDGNALVKSYIHQQPLIGADKIVIPGKEATDEDWSKVYGALGRPETPAGYDFSELGVPEGLPINDRVALGMIHAMHQQGLNQRQLSGILRTYMALQHEEYGKSVQAALDKANGYERTLRDKWGDAYDAKVDLANRVFKAGAGSPEAVTEIRKLGMADGTPLGDNPVLIEFLATLAEKGLTEDVLLGDKGVSRFTKTPAEAKDEIARRQRDSSIQAILADGGHPDHAREVEIDRQLWQQAVPETEKEPIA
jgi:hypothetical protein